MGDGTAEDEGDEGSTKKRKVKDILPAYCLAAL
jgi:hypothetical protein